MVRINLKFGFSRTATNITILKHIHTSRTRKRGRPRKNINPEVLHDAFQKGRSISTTVLASILGIDRKTLQAQKKEMGIESGFDLIGDDDLDSLVQEYHQENPAGGRSYVIGRLRAAHSLRIQRHRVIDSINRIDRLGQAMRQRVGKKKERRQYQVPRPNALWHIDGHHKLIAWGIVIHGVADGYSRKVCILHSALLLDTILRLIRSQDCVQVRTTDLKQFLTCLLMQYWSMVSLQECVVIGEAKIGMFLYL